MSGFLGILRQDGEAFDERQLERIRKPLRVRGPDAQNSFVERDFASCYTIRGH
jgi:asparagine synthetase B (glutamine-hydrolysing)